MKKYTVVIFVVFLLAGCGSGVNDITTDYAEQVLAGTTVHIGSWVSVLDDEFDAIESDVWGVSDGSAFGTSKATFREDSVSIKTDGDNSFLKMTMTVADDLASNFDKNYKGGQITSKQLYHFGKYSARMKCGKGSGQVSAFFTYNQAKDAEGVERVNEIDFEIMGEALNKVQLNNWFDPVDLLIGHGYMFEEDDFNTQDEFHIYTFVWLEEEVFFYVDDKLVRYTKSNVPQAPSFLLFNYWMAGYGPSWGGWPDADALPATFEVDWVKAWKMAD